ncbi:hypothetical protein [Streptomyces sp. NPDC088554]|uniref:hypothetical protein n=1 Tax=Streptomyces sp. NPDC088554 TaxID=3365865 RepID=UPI003825BC33
MVVHQLPAERREFARYLRDLAALLDPAGGWYEVFGHRDPDGLRACFDGAQIPPWDVVESLLQDFAAERDERTLAHETARARRLYAAAVAVHDRLPGGGDALSGRLRLMFREQSYAAGRAEELVRTLRTVPEGSPGAERLTHDLAWIRDDHARATARIAELSSRIAALAVPGHTAPGPRPPAPDEGPPDEEPRGRASTLFKSSRAGKESSRDRREKKERGKEKRPAPQRKPRGARFAGLDEDETEEPGQEPAPAPAVPTAPRGARFVAVPAEPLKPETATVSPEDRWAATGIVAELIRLRAEGRSGEAHVVLCEAAGRPPGQLPLLAAELHRAGLGADWAELLWEASFLPPAQLAAAAGALAVAGRDDDCGQLLRQVVSRPAEDIADAVLALGGAGRGQEAKALLSAFVQTRAPEDAALVATPDPRRLVPQLIEAARAVSAARERALVHALRAAGLLAS